MLIALASGKGAPGTSVTAAALAAMWPRPVLLVEADPRGGSVLYGLGQGRDAGGRGLLGLELTARRLPLPEALELQVVQLDVEWPETYVLPGVDSSRQAASVSWATLGQFLAGQDRYDVIADCGALPAARTPSGVWGSADLTVLVTRSTMAAAHFAEDAADLLRADLQATGLGVDRLVSVVVGPGRPYPTGDLERFLQSVAPVEGTVSWDPAAAEVFSDGAQVARRRLRRSPLLRSAGQLAEVLGGLALQHRHRNPQPFAAAPDAPVATPAAPEPISPTSLVTAQHRPPALGLPFQAPRITPARAPGSSAGVNGHG